MFRKIATTAVLGFGLSAGAASAAPVYAQAVTAFSGATEVGSCAIDGSGSLAYEVNSRRDNICNALGEEDQKGDGKDFGFVSAGNFTALKFTFGGDFNGPIDLFEITFNRNTGWEESVDLVFLISGVEGAEFGKAVRNGAPDAVADEFNKDRWIISFDTDLGPFSELWVFDTSTGRPGDGGGFDIDAIRAVSVPPVPLPAAGLLLIAGLGGLALMRRRG